MSGRWSDSIEQVKKLLIVIHEYIGFITLVSSVISAKMGISYPDLNQVMKFRTGYLVTATNH